MIFNATSEITHRGTQTELDVLQILDENTNKFCPDDIIAQFYGLDNCKKKKFLLDVGGPGGLCNHLVQVARQNNLDDIVRLLSTVVSLTRAVGFQEAAQKTGCVCSIDTQGKTCLQDTCMYKETSSHNKSNDPKNDIPIYVFVNIKGHTLPMCCIFGSGKYCKNTCYSSVHVKAASELLEGLGVCIPWMMGIQCPRLSDLRHELPICQTYRCTAACPNGVKCRYLHIHPASGMVEYTPIADLPRVRLGLGSNQNHPTSIHKITPHVQQQMKRNKESLINYCEREYFNSMASKKDIPIEVASKSCFLVSNRGNTDKRSSSSHDQGKRSSSNEGKESPIKSKRIRKEPEEQEKKRNVINEKNTEDDPQHRFKIFTCIEDDEFLEVAKNHCAVCVTSKPFMPVTKFTRLVNVDEEFEIRQVLKNEERFNKLSVCCKCGWAIDVEL